MGKIKNFSEFINESKELIVNNTTLSPVNVGDIKILSSKEEIDRYSNFVWDMLEKSYEHIGGLQSYRNYSDFKKKNHKILVVIDFNSATLLACATFRRIENSLKMTAIGCSQDDKGKLALQQIIQHTILELELHYWSEVSGAIEHYFKKHNGFPMPNTMAGKILQIPEKDITISNKDMVHYDRPIGKDREVFTKMIFGIKSDEIFQQAMNEVENYYDFMKEVNNMINESKEFKYSIKQSIYIIENLYRLHEENKVNELTPKWADALKESMKTLRKSTKNQTISDYIEYGEYLLSDMQILELNTINISKGV